MLRQEREKICAVKCGRQIRSRDTSTGCEKNESLKTKHRYGFDKDTGLHVSVMLYIKDADIQMKQYDEKQSHDVV